MEEEISIGISFGAMGAPLKEQLEKQGYSLSEQDNERFQKLITSINMVQLHHLVPDSVCHTARKRLLKEIIKSLKPIVNL
jgi:hypothetical protein